MRQRRLVQEWTLNQREIHEVGRSSEVVESERRMLRIFLLSYFSFFLANGNLAVFKVLYSLHCYGGAFRYKNYRESKLRFLFSDIGNTPGISATDLRFVVSHFTSPQIPQRGVHVCIIFQIGIPSTSSGFSSEQAYFFLGYVTLSHQYSWWEKVLPHEIFITGFLLMSGEVKHGYSVVICLWSPLMDPPTCWFTFKMERQPISFLHLNPPVYLTTVYCKILSGASLVQENSN